MASQHLQRFELGLRASDALHLAIVSDYRMTLATLDKRMIAAATVFGIDLVNI